MALERLAVARGPFLTDVEVEQNTRTGSTTIRTWEGSLAEVYNKRILDKLNGASQVIIRPKHDGTWVLMSHFPFDENGLESVNVPGVHELEVQTLLPSAWINPKLRNTFTDGQLAAIQQVVKDYESGFYPRDGTKTAAQDAEADVSKALTKAGASGQKLSLGVKWFQDVAYRKTESYFDFTSVYTRTLTAASPLQVQASYEGVGKIWTSAEVMMWEHLDFNGFFQLDFGMQWLKGKPHVVAVAGQKTQVVYTYQETKQASWFLYDPWGSAVLFNAP